MIDLDAAEKLANGFRGRFEFKPDDDAGYDRLEYLSADGEPYEIAERLDREVAEPLAEMLNMFRPLIAEVRQLRTRRDELLAAMVRVANETPFADEAKDALAQRGKLLAEIGTLKAERDALAAKLADAHEQLDACCERCLDKCPHAPTVSP